MVPRPPSPPPEARCSAAWFNSRARPRARQKEEDITDSGKSERTNGERRGGARLEEDAGESVCGAAGGVKERRKAERLGDEGVAAPISASSIPFHPVRARTDPGELILLSSLGDSTI
jgi:hypothetical protein